MARASASASACAHPWVNPLVFRVGRDRANVIVLRAQEGSNIDLSRVIIN